MAWNEPGGDKDPWSGKGGKGDNDGPPDLDEVVKNLQQKLNSLFGRKDSGRGGNDQGGGEGGGGASLPNLGGGLLGVAGAVIGVIWLSSGFYIVEPAERGVVLHFGSFKEVTSPGLNWRIPYPVEDVSLVNVDQISSFGHRAQMLTRDENIVDIEFTIQSRVLDPADYLFQDQSPDKTLKDVTETVIRETIGKAQLDYILTEGRSAVQDQIRSAAQELINSYRTGMEVTSVNMQPARPPEQVKSAFDDAIKSREDKARLENKAQAYANEVVPKARGDAARILADANAFREKVTNEATGESARFLSVMTEYHKAPEVTRERLYLETVQHVLTTTPKALVDVKGGNNLVYLPLDRMMQPRTLQEIPVSQQTTTPMAPVTAVPLPADTRGRDDDRQRSSR